MKRRNIMKNKKQVSVAVAAGVCVCACLCGVGCGGGGETVSISGSTSVQPLMLELASAFEDIHPEINVEVSGGGSSKGVTDAQSGRVDLGMASRALKSSETGLESRQLAIDAIALIVNTNCMIDNVTSEEVFGLYANAMPVSTVTKAIARSSSSGTRDAFDSLVSSDGVFLADVSLPDGVQELESGGLVVTTIERNTVGDTMGYVSLGAVTENVKALSFDGVAATAENVGNGTYKLSRSFNLVWKADVQFSAATQAFFDFVFGEQGKVIIQAEGYVLI